MAVAQVNGQSITYEDNEADGPTIVWSHGFLMDHTMFDAQIDVFGADYRCIRWDERGFGATPATGPFTYWDSADDCVALLDHLGVDDAVFIGMSQGGFLSLRAALRYPDRVRAMVLIDSQLGVDPDESIEGYRGMVAHWLSDEPLGEVGQFVAGLILGEPELSATWIDIWEQRRGPHLEFAGGALLDRDDISDRVAELKMPILSVHGEDDQAISIEEAETLQAQVADGRGLIRVPGGAHAPNMTHPDIVNAGIADFLAAL